LSRRYLALADLELQQKVLSKERAKARRGEDGGDMEREGDFYLF
jgi:hypothetical protein